MAGPTRIVLTLPAGDQAWLRMAADLARLLDVGLHGLFIEDRGLLAFASLPFAREIRLPTYEWHALSPEQMTRDLHQTAALMRRRLDEAARKAGVPSSFETLPGPEAPPPYRVGDVIIAAHPGAAVRRVSVSAAKGCETGFTLLVPPQAPARASGPFAALVTPDGGAALDMACRLALAAREGLILLGTGEAPLRAAAEQAAAMGVAPGRIVRRLVPTTNRAELLRALAGLRERLVVMPPPQPADEAWPLAMALHVPVLLVEQHCAM
ncbi:hypothetical protein [Acidocella sp.]|uniref:hypothetical protein n=1 Tax=Acidocella sp. TaxID=50710 RepID=UPI0026103951|nr:hypothetical protein [Acidocella sp.]